ncbi:ribonuclease HIII [Exiguobacterium sp. AB2]|uniref:ribonuclease HIII n=1 Tax=Exiguobacterium sp. AB2 TaxID=1484479 RepID=UPI0004A955EC|nr:ribonuclease HIII [Exiguobacterium sp. AB2]KDN57250.1 ribonuclease HIII [Exiguobacterium sp. AB2]
MGNQVIKLSIEAQNALIERYSPYAVNPPPYAKFSAKTPSCVITVYNSGKVMFQGQTAETEAAKWGTPEAKKVAAASTLPDGFSNWSVVGSDEVGKGDYFGPLVIVAAYVPKEKIDLVKELGVKDSKQLSDTDIKRIARDLHVTIPYQKATLHNPMYNKMQKTMTQGKMTAIAHNAALSALLEKLEEKPDAILIDQFTEKNVYYKHLSHERNIVNADVYFSTKAEGLHVAVAAASILARAFFLKEMDQLSQTVGLTLPKGAGAKVDQVAASLIKRDGVERLNNIAKVHFANTKKALRLSELKR